MSFFSQVATKEKEIQIAREDPTSIGAILVEKGWLSHEMLGRALEVQLAAAPPLGELLVSLSFITREQLDEALFEQQVRRGKVKPRVVLERRMSEHKTLVETLLGKTSELTNMSRALTMKLKSR